MKSDYSKKKKKSKSVKTFIIMANKRSGSTWLLDTMNLHPQIKGIYEPFHDKIWGNEYRRILKNDGVTKLYNRIMDNLISKNNPNTTVYGFKVITEDANDNTNISLALEADCIILLERITVESIVSCFKSENLHKWHFYDGETCDFNKHKIYEKWPRNLSKKIKAFRNKKMKINIQWIRRILNDRKRRLTILMAQIQKANKKILHISYDKLFGNKRKSMKKIYRILDVDSVFKQYSSEIKIHTNYNWVINKDEINEQLGEEFGYLS